ncbi:MAG: fimbrillin family protein, partial [Prevotella sp.]|nr:fimbrillin family protein [Prevotella sp.]
GDSWTYSPQAYFPTDNATVEGDTYVEFMAYSPSASTNVDEGLKAADDADQTITYTVPKPLATGVTSQEDFLVAYEKKDAATSGSAYSGTVNLQFRHALSRVLVAAGSSLTEPVVITGLVLRNLYTTGNLPMNSATTVWASAADPDDYSYILPPAGVSVFRYPVLSPPSSLPLVTSYEQGMFVLPQTTAGDLNDADDAETAVEDKDEFGLELHYTIGGLVKEPYYIQFGDLAAPASGPGVTFEPGKQYVLNLTFGAGSGTGGGGGGSDQPSVDIGATISFGELGVDGYGPDIAVPKPKAFEPKPAVWSQSNIYYDEDAIGTSNDNVGALTFSESDISKNLYQGIYFKWGSLIGVSAGDNMPFSSSYLFIPDSEGKYHKVAVSALDSHGNPSDAVGLFKDRLGYLGVIDFTDYDDIWDKLPYVKQDDADVPVKIPQLTGATYRDDYALTAASNTLGATLYNTYRGDICRYLMSKKSSNGNSGLAKATWRMPTLREFGGDGMNNSDGSSLSDPAPGVYDTQWNKDYSGLPGTFTGGVAADGTAELFKDNTENWYYTLVRYIFDPAKDVLSYTPSFPVSGDRVWSDGRLYNVGNESHYWTAASVSGSPNARYMHLSKIHITDAWGDYLRTYGCNVRCVRDGENVAP